MKENLKTEYLRLPGTLPTKWQVFYEIASNPGEFTSGEALARKLGISRPMVWKAVQSLLDAGFPIQSVKRKGYRLWANSEAFTYPTMPRMILDRLKTLFLGHHIYYTWETGSTNDDAKVFSEDEENAPNGTLVIAETQTRGKGRLERRWFSPLGGVFMSIILRPKIHPANLPGLALVTGYSLAVTISRFLGNPEKKVSLKWPNDVLIGGKKISGILSEMRAEMDRVDHVILGIGINANFGLGSFSHSVLPEEVEKRTTSLAAELGHPFDKNELIVQFLNYFEPSYLEFLKSGLVTFLPGINGMLAYKGKKVIIKNTHHPPNTQSSPDQSEISPDDGIMGTLLGLDPTGHLLLETPSGILRIPAGDVSLRDFDA